MSTESIKFNLLSHQIEHEKTLSKLYKSYSILFPSEEVWSKLEKEEKKHAAWIQQIITKICNDTIYFREDPECCEQIKTSLKKMDQEISKANNNEIDLIHAFKVAIEIEESMVEREFFKSMDSDAPFVEDILSKIVADTEKHREALILAKNNYLDRLSRGETSENHKVNDIIEDKAPLTRDEDIDLDRDLDNRKK